MHLVVLAAGVGRRFGGLKQLAPVGPRGESIMDVLLARAAAEGFDHAVVVVRAEIEGTIATHLARFAPALPYELVVQPVPADRERPLGTAQAVLLCRDAVAGAFAVVNADDLYPSSSFRILVQRVTQSSEHGLVAFRLGKTVLGDRPVSRAVLTIDDQDCVVAIRENTALTPSPAIADTWVSMNMWGFQPSIFDELDPAVTAFMSRGANGEVLLPDVVAAMVATGRTVRAARCEERCIGITYAEDAETVRRTLA